MMSDNRTELNVFDFDDPEQWNKVLDIVDDPLALRALDAGMNALCDKLGKKWDRGLGPWRFTDRANPNWRIFEAEPPTPNSPNWYRISGHCNTIAPWCTAIGSLLFPDHDWRYVHNPNLPKFDCHSAGIGIRDEKSSLVVMDILFSPETLRTGKELELVQLLTSPESMDIPLLEAIELFETGWHI